MNHASPSALRPPAGFTLMEVMISIGILAVALSTIAGTIGYSSARAAEMSRKTQATWLLEGMLGEVRGAIRDRQPQSAVHRIEIPAGLPGQTRRVPPSATFMAGSPGRRPHVKARNRDRPSFSQAFSNHETYSRIGSPAEGDGLHPR